jgi:putative radical SAM enzyme (TIGR03279 family)
MAAIIASVADGCVAHRGGIHAGMTLLAVDGQPLRDYIDWLWLSSEPSVELQIAELGTVVLEREAGEPWGIEFASPVFDGVRTCVNNCAFCFMAMLPKGLRPSLYLRDDDYRLSFLQGNFVTLTNITDSDIERIISYHLSPLHVSLHAVSAAVRQKLMGRNHARGIEVLQRLLGAGIEIHAQIVLVPGVNDGAVLTETLDWVAARPGVTVCGIVPYGYTKYAALQRGFDGAGCQAVVEQVGQWQAANPTACVQLADEFFVKAWPHDTLAHLPSADYYAAYPMLYDGIGMLRSFADDIQAARRGEHCSPAEPSNPTSRTLIATGQAFAPFLTRLLNAAGAPNTTTVLPIKNNFFGGNVDVAGLLTATDIIEQVSVHLKTHKADQLLLPPAIFNDDGLTLDDKTLADIQQALLSDALN